MILQVAKRIANIRFDLSRIAQRSRLEYKEIPHKKHRIDKKTGYDKRQKTGKSGLRISVLMKKSGGNEYGTTEDSCSGR